jgi:hypothetical protein
MRHPVDVSLVMAEPHDSADRRRKRAMHVATTVARSHGLDVRDARVLADANNTIIHLRPTPIVGKVSTTWIRDGSRVLKQELALAQHVVEHGGPMPPPAAELPVRVHHHDGLAMTFWRYVHCSPIGPPAATTVASLRRLHAALEGYPGSIASFDGQLRELAAALADAERTPTLAAADRAFLRATLLDLLNDVLRWNRPALILHGDPHEGNRITTDGDVVGSTSRPHRSARSSGT